MCVVHLHICIEPPYFPHLYIHIVTAISHTLNIFYILCPKTPIPMNEYIYPVLQQRNPSRNINPLFNISPKDAKLLLWGHLK